MKHLKQCDFCKKKVYKIAGHGLCAACYYREKRNGTPDYVKVRKPCTVEGCERLSAAKGLCDIHYARMRKRGIDAITSDHYEKWGHSTQHPLQRSWQWIRRRKSQRVAKEWDDFWNFVRDVGEKPSPRHSLWRKDESKPYGPDNFYWRERKTDLVLSDKESRATYMRTYRVMEPRKFKDVALKKQYGISVDRYEAMLASQNGKCAICGNGEKMRIRGVGTALAVDHCHSTGKIRGLLCVSCNRALGLFKDDPAILRKAIAYLRRG